MKAVQLCIVSGMHKTCARTSFPVIARQSTCLKKRNHQLGSRVRPGCTFRTHRRAVLGSRHGWVEDPLNPVEWAGAAKSCSAGEMQCPQIGVSHEGREGHGNGSKRLMSRLM